MYDFTSEAQKLVEEKDYDTAFIIVTLILNSIPVNLSYNAFVQELEKLKYERVNNTHLLQRLHNVFNRYVLSLGGWFKIYSDKIIGAHLSDTTHRIYVAVDNSCLHNFALLLVKYCEL